MYLLQVNTFCQGTSRFRGGQKTVRQFHSQILFLSFCSECNPLWLATHDYQLSDLIAMRSMLPLTKNCAYDIILFRVLLSENLCHDCKFV